MSGAPLAALAFGAMLSLIVLRMPIGLAMLAVGAVGYVHLTSLDAFLFYVQTNTYHQFANYTLSVIPLFVLMGALAERSGAATALFRAAERRLAGVRGGLPMSVIFACTAFGSICGSSVATTATFGRAALPEMRRAGCEPGFASGTVAIGGTMGILVPPSVILVIYAISAEQNIAKLFQAALLPGLLAAGLYIATIAIVVRRNPELAPARAAAAAAPPRRSGAPRVLGYAGLAALPVLWLAGLVPTGPFVLLALLALLLAFVDAALVPLLSIGLVVVGGIYGGVFTPTEGAGVGTVGMLLAGLLQRKLGRAEIATALVQTAQTTGMIFLILLGAEIFGAFLALTRMPTTLAQAIGGSGWTPTLVLLGIMLTYLVLGAVMDELAMLLLTLPLFVPIVLALDFGMSAEDTAIWFGILVLVVVGIGMTAPPIGINVFVVNKMAEGVPITKTYRGVLPFVLADLVRLVVLLSFPAITLWLVRVLN